MPGASGPNRRRRNDFLTLKIISFTGRARRARAVRAAFPEGTDLARRWFVSSASTPATALQVPTALSARAAATTILGCGSADRSGPRECRTSAAQVGNHSDYKTSMPEWTSTPSPDCRRSMSQEASWFPASSARTPGRIQSVVAEMHQDSSEQLPVRPKRTRQ